MIDEALTRCCHPAAAAAAVQVAGMRWGTAYTLLVLGGKGIMAADMVSELQWVR